MSAPFYAPVAGQINGIGSAEALRRLAAGRDSEAWSAILHLHGPGILRMAQQLTGDGAFCDDVCQEALLQIREHAGQFTPPDGACAAESAAKGWIMCIAYRTALGMLRLRARRSQNETQAGLSQLARVPSERDAVIAAEELSLLRQEINDLPELLRGALCLHFFGQMSYAELSAALACSETTARKRVERAVKRLRERLALGGISMSAGTLMVSLSEPAPAAGTNAAPAVAPGASNPFSTCLAKWQALLHHPAAPALSGVAHIGGLVFMTKTILIAAASVAVAVASVQTFRVNALNQDLNELRAKTASAEVFAMKFNQLEKQFAETRGETAALKAYITAQTNGMARIEGKVNALETKQTEAHAFNFPVPPHIAGMTPGKIDAAIREGTAAMAAAVVQADAAKAGATKTETWNADGTKSETKKELKDFTFQVIGQMDAGGKAAGSEGKDRLYVFKQEFAVPAIAFVPGTAGVRVEVAPDATPIKPPKEPKQNGVDENF